MAGATSDGILGPVHHMHHRHTALHKEATLAKYTSKLKNCSHEYSGKELNASISMHTAEYSLLTAECMLPDETWAALLKFSHD